MPIMVQVALFFAGLFALTVLIPKLALRLGAPYHWFPARDYPLCPSCKARDTLVCFYQGSRWRNYPSPIPDYYRCSESGARWMKVGGGDGRWQDASARENDFYYSRGPNGEGAALSPDE